MKRNDMRSLKCNCDTHKKHKHLQLNMQIGWQYEAALSALTQERPWISKGVIISKKNELVYGVKSVLKVIKMVSYCRTWTILLNRNLQDHKLLRPKRQLDTGSTRTLNNWRILLKNKDGLRKKALQKGTLKYYSEPSQYYKAERPLEEILLEPPWTFKGFSWIKSKTLKTRCVNANIQSQLYLKVKAVIYI